MSMVPSSEDDTAAPLAAAAVEPAAAVPSPLSDRTFRTLWTATLGSNLGIVMQSVGASWLMVETGGSPQLIALVQTAASLPLMLLSPLGGALADSGDRRRIMIGAQLCLVTTSVALAVATWMGAATPAVVLAATFLVGTSLALNGPAWMASLGDILPRAALPGAVVYNALGLNLARSVGPAVGGAIVAAVGAGAAFCANAATACTLAVVLLLWRPHYPRRSLPPERVDDALRAGLRYAALSPSLIRVLLRTFIFALSGSFAQALMPLVARDLLHGDATTFGLLFAAFGAGAFLGAASGRRLRALMSPEAIVRLAAVLTVAALAVEAASASQWLTMAALLLAGAAWVTAFATFNVCVQLSSPRWVVGRTLSLYQTAVFAGVALGGWISGLTATGGGTSRALLGGALLALVGVALSWRLRLDTVGADDMSIEPVERSLQIASIVPVTPRSGPIGITIDHRIASSDVPAFMALMRERRRIRVRDGARRWALLRDMEDAELWVERYYFPTWLAYLRHQQRRTRAYEDNRAQLEKLWIDGREAAIRRRIERDIGYPGRPQDHFTDAAIEPF